MRAFEATQHYFHQAADQLQMPDWMRKLLITPKREVSVQVAFERDNGSIDTLVGYRVQHDNSRGPMKGGLRYHPGVDLEIAVSQATANTLGMDLRWQPTRNVAEVREALAAFETEKPDALVVLPDAVMIEGRRETAEFALRNRIPAVSGWGMFAHSDGLFTYGPRLSESFKRLAHYTARILKGAAPSDLPIERSTHLEFIVNAKTASRIGLSLPQQLLGFADEIIE
jgi:ABC-type uncharacterized transport system substrate-binding protein